ncbi:hypothetical protein [Streptosporangium carneum]
MLDHLYEGSVVALGHDEHALRSGVDTTTDPVYDILVPGAERQAVAAEIRHPAQEMRLALTVPPNSDDLPVVI